MGALTGLSCYRPHGGVIMPVGNTAVSLTVWLMLKQQVVLCRMFKRPDALRLIPAFQVALRVWLFQVNADVHPVRWLFN